MSDKDDHNAIIDGIEEIKKILNGNGKIGLCAKVELLWGNRKWILTACGTVILGTIMLVIRAYVA